MFCVKSSVNLNHFRLWRRRSLSLGPFCELQESTSQAKVFVSYPAKRELVVIVTYAADSATIADCSICVAIFGQKRSLLSCSCHSLIEYGFPRPAASASRRVRYHNSLRQLQYPTFLAEANHSS